MNTRDCKTIRQEIDESNPADSLSGKVREHLGVCGECRSFETEQRTLQRLMAGLETVTAPPDFDFRLRARLAREKSSAGNGHGFASLLRIPRPISIAALVLLLALVGVLIKNRTGSQVTPVRQAESKAPNVPGINKTVDQQANAGGNGAGLFTVDNSAPKPQSPPKRIVNTPRNDGMVAQRAKGTKVRDSGLTPANLVTVTQPNNGNGILRVPLDDQALRISIDDGRGTPRSVSLPIVSFGSQRLMTSNSFVPASSQKRVW